MIKQLRTISSIMSTTSSEAQSQLIEAFKALDYDRFKNALDAGAQPTLRPSEPKGQMSIYEQALSTPGCSKFIRACLRSGCLIDFVSVPGAKDCRIANDRLYCDGTGESGLEEGGH